MKANLIPHCTHRPWCISKAARDLAAWWEFQWGVVYLYKYSPQSFFGEVLPFFLQRAKVLSQWGSFYKLHDDIQPVICAKAQKGHSDLKGMQNPGKASQIRTRGFQRACRELAVGSTLAALGVITAQQQLSQLKFTMASVIMRNGWEVPKAMSQLSQVTGHAS